MMETKDKLLKWEELSQDAKDHAIRHYREHGFSYDWWDSVYEVAKEEGAKLGFYIDTIYFSGFWSQGDGACWTGQIAIDAWLDSQGIDSIGVDALKCLINLDYMCNSVRVTHNSSHYNHENTMNVGEIEGSWQMIDPDELDWEELKTQEVKTGSIFDGMSVAELVLINTTDEANPYKVTNMHKLQEAIEESAKDYARDIYKQLREEYEYLTSDESIAEILQANDYDFTDEGEIA